MSRFPATGIPNPSEGRTAKKIPFRPSHVPNGIALHPLHGMDWHSPPFEAT